MLASGEIEQLVVTHHARHRFALRVRADLRRQPALQIDTVIRGLAATGALRYGRPSWKDTTCVREPSWLIEVVARGWHSSCGCAYMRVALVLTCDADAWWVATVLTPPIRHSRAARLFAPAWEALAALSSLSRDQLAGERLPWIVGVLADAAMRTPATRLLSFAAHANDLLERLGSDWRISQAGEPRRATP